MHTSTLLFTLAASAAASPIARRDACTAEKRLAGAALIISSYNAVQPGESAAGFLKLPLEDDCKTYINPDGGPAVPVAVDATTTRDFALTTRQAFSKVTGEFTDFAANGTTVIHTNVTLGATHAVSAPVTFSADVYLDYNLDSCLMGKIQAFATVPSVAAGIPVTPPSVSGLSGVLRGISSSGRR